MNLKLITDKQDKLLEQNLQKIDKKYYKRQQDDCATSSDDADHTKLHIKGHTTVFEEQTRKNLEDLVGDQYENISVTDTKRQWIKKKDLMKKHQQARKTTIDVNARKCFQIELKQIMKETFKVNCENLMKQYPLLQSCLEQLIQFDQRKKQEIEVAKQRARNDSINRKRRPGESGEGTVTISGTQSIKNGMLSVPKDMALSPAPQHSHNSQAVHINPTSFMQFTKKQQQMMAEFENMKAENERLKQTLKEMRANWRKEVEHYKAAEYIKLQRDSKAIEEIQEQHKVIQSKNMPQNPAAGFESDDEENKDDYAYAGYRIIDAELFDALEGIDPKLKQLMNEKILKIRNKFQELLACNTKHQNTLNKKIELMNQLSPDAYSIANLTIPKIFESLALREMDPVKIWKALNRAYGVDYFLAIIEQEYGQRFVRDYNAMYEEIRKVKLESEYHFKQISKATEREIMHLKQLCAFKDNELSSFREGFMKTVEKVQEDTRELIDNEYKAKENQMILEFDRQQKDLLDELATSEELNKDFNKTLDKEKMRLAFQKMFFLSKLHKLKDKVGDIYTQEMTLQVVFGFMRGETQQKAQEVKARMQQQIEYLNEDNASTTIQLHDYMQRLRLAQEKNFLLDQKIQSMSMEVSMYQAVAETSKQDARRLESEITTYKHTNQNLESIIDTLNREKIRLMAELKRHTKSTYNSNILEAELFRKNAINNIAKVGRVTAQSVYKDITRSKECQTEIQDIKKTVKIVSDEQFQLVRMPTRPNWSQTEPIKILDRKEAEKLRARMQLSESEVQEVLSRRNSREDINHTDSPSNEVMSIEDQVTDFDKTSKSLKFKGKRPNSRMSVINQRNANTITNSSVKSGANSIGSRTKPQTKSASVQCTLIKDSRQHSQTSVTSSGQKKMLRRSTRFGKQFTFKHGKDESIDEVQEKKPKRPFMSKALTEQVKLHRAKPKNIGVNPSPPTMLSGPSPELKAKIRRLKTRSSGGGSMTSQPSTKKSPATSPPPIRKNSAKNSSGTREVLSFKGQKNAQVQAERSSSIISSIKSLGISRPTTSKPDKKIRDYDPDQQPPQPVDTKATLKMWIQISEKLQKLQQIEQRLKDKRQREIEKLLQIENHKKFTSFVARDKITGDAYLDVIKMCKDLPNISQVDFIQTIQKTRERAEQDLQLNVTGCSNQQEVINRQESLNLLKLLNTTILKVFLEHLKHPNSFTVSDGAHHTNLVPQSQAKTLTEVAMMSAESCQNVMMQPTYYQNSQEYVINLDEQPTDGDQNLKSNKDSQAAHTNLSSMNDGEKSLMPRYDKNKGKNFGNRSSSQHTPQSTIAVTQHKLEGVLPYNDKLSNIQSPEQMKQISLTQESIPRTRTVESSFDRRLTDFATQQLTSMTKNQLYNNYYNGETQNDKKKAVTPVRMAKRANLAQRTTLKGSAPGSSYMLKRKKSLSKRLNELQKKQAKSKFVILKQQLMEKHPEDFSTPGEAELLGGRNILFYSGFSTRQNKDQELYHNGRSASQLLSHERNTSFTTSGMNNVSTLLTNCDGAASKQFSTQVGPRSSTVMQTVNGSKQKLEIAKGDISGGFNGVQNFKKARKIMQRSNHTKRQRVKTAKSELASDQSFIKEHGTLNPSFRGDDSGQGQINQFTTDTHTSLNISISDPTNKRILPVQFRGNKLEDDSFKQVKENQKIKVTQVLENLQENSKSGEESNALDL